MNTQMVNDSVAFLTFASNMMQCFLGLTLVGIAASVVLRK